MPRPRKQKPEPVHVVRRWASSPVLYGRRGSDDPMDNPDFHPPVSLTSKGTFISDAGAVLDPKDVPEYVRREAKATSLDTEYRPPKSRQLSMRDAMLAAGAEDTDPDPTARRGRRVSKEVFA